MKQTAKNPAGGTGRGFECSRRYSYKCKPRPPYSRLLNPLDKNSIAVLTGSGGWHRARSMTWFPGRKLVLPYGEDPAGFNWSPVKAFPAAIIFSFGTPESGDIVLALAGELLRFVDLVLFSGHGPLTRFEPKRAAA